MNIIHTGSLMV